MDSKEHYKVILDRLDNAILKQAIRDLASKKKKIYTESKSFFFSKSFEDFCERNNFHDTEVIRRGVTLLDDFPLISRKRMVEEIARMLDKKSE